MPYTSRRALSCPSLRTVPRTTVNRKPKGGLISSAFFLSAASRLEAWHVQCVAQRSTSRSRSASLPCHERPALTNSCISCAFDLPLCPIAGVAANRKPAQPCVFDLPLRSMAAMMLGYGGLNGCAAVGITTKPSSKPPAFLVSCLIWATLQSRSFLDWIAGRDCGFAFGFPAGISS